MTDIAARGQRSRISRRSRGFTLIEIIVVVFIVGVVAVIAWAEFGKIFKTADLSARANEIEAFVKRVPLEAQRRGLQMFVRITAQDGNGARTFQSWADSNPAPNGNGTWEAADTLVEQLTIPAQIVFSRTTEDALDVTQMDVTGSNATAVAVLGYDFRGRAFRPSTARQIPGIATIPVLHLQMVESPPGLTPPIDNQVRIDPLWGVTVKKAVKGSPDFP